MGAKTRPVHIADLLGLQNHNAYTNSNNSNYKEETSDYGSIRVMGIIVDKFQWNDENEMMMLLDDGTGAQYLEACQKALNSEDSLSANRIDSNLNEMNQENNDGWFCLGFNGMLVAKVGMDGIEYGGGELCVGDLIDCKGSFVKLVEDEVNRVCDYLNASVEVYALKRNLLFQIEHWRRYKDNDMESLRILQTIASVSSRTTKIDEVLQPQKILHLIENASMHDDIECNSINQKNKEEDDLRRGLNETEISTILGITVTPHRPLKNSNKKYDSRKNSLIQENSDEYRKSLRLVLQSLRDEGKIFMNLRSGKYMSFPKK